MEVAASTLDYGKWELVGTEEIHDVATCGLVAPSLSTALSSADSLAGDDESPLHHQSAAAGRSRQLLVVGKHPMVAFYLVEEQFLSFTTAVSLASTVATKLTSAVFSLARNWWGGGAPKEECVLFCVPFLVARAVGLFLLCAANHRLIDGALQQGSRAAQANRDARHTDIQFLFE